MKRSSSMSSLLPGLLVSVLLTGTAWSQDESGSESGSESAAAAIGQAPATDAVETAAQETTTGDAAGSEGTTKATDSSASLNDSAEKSDPDKKTAVVVPPGVELPFAIRPYLVNVSVSFQNGCLSDSAQRAAVIDDIRDSVTRMYGRTWDVAIDESEWFLAADRRRLQRLQVSDVFDRYPEQEVHKAFFLTVQSHGSGFELGCREYDSRVHEMTPVYSRQTHDLRSIGSFSAELLRDSFRPCVLFLRNFQDEDGTALMDMQIQAGEIVPPDPSAEQVQEDDVLRPFIRSMDRRDPTKLKQLRAMTLSYIRVMAIDREIARGRMTGLYLTHMPQSLFGGKGRRLQHFALRQRPTDSQSRVQLVLQSRPDKPLISHRMALAYQMNYKDAEDGPQTQLVSDRNGEVIIQSREKHPTFWIRVYSGSSLLARVPYAPGLIPFDIIELPDDSIRLGVEGEIQLLADQLIDAIALRGVLLARARKEADAGNIDEVDALLTRYDEVPSKDFFLEKISNIRIPAENAVQLRGMSPRRITALCTSLSGTVSTFFSDEKRAERLEDIQKIRQLAEQKSR